MLESQTLVDEIERPVGLKSPARFGGAFLPRTNRVVQHTPEANVDQWQSTLGPFQTGEHTREQPRLNLPTCDHENLSKAMVAA